MAVSESERDASLPTSAIDSRITSTSGSFNSRGEHAAFAACPRAMQPKPQRAARVKPHLTMRPKLRFVRSPPLRHLARGSGVAYSWRALRSNEPSGGALRRAAFSAANEECEPTSDVPCRRAASDRSPPRRGQNRFLRRPVKGAGIPGSERLSSTSASRPPEGNWDGSVSGSNAPHALAFAKTSDASPPPLPCASPHRPGFRRSFARSTRRLSS